MPLKSVCCVEVQYKNVINLLFYYLNSIGGTGSYFSLQNKGTTIVRQIVLVYKNR